LTTETEGLWYTSNLSAATPTFSAVTSYPFRQPERVFFNPYNPNEIWVTSFGNGLRVGNVCGYSLSSTSSFFGISGGSGSFPLSTGNGCAWSVASNNNWIVISSVESGYGPDMIMYEVRENFTGSPRIGTISVAGQTFTILQDAGLDECLYMISPKGASVSSGGGTGMLNVMSGVNCAWLAASDVGWVTITSSGMGIGNGTVNYSVAANATGVSRRGRITVAGQVFTIKQK
jgi:Putative binding domain, N-terminal/Viral BACON domain